MAYVRNRSNAKLDNYEEQKLIILWRQFRKSLKSFFSRNYYFVRFSGSEITKKGAHCSWNSNSFKNFKFSSCAYVLCTKCIQSGAKCSCKSRKCKFLNFDSKMSIIQGPSSMIFLLSSTSVNHPLRWLRKNHYFINFLLENAFAFVFLIV